MRPKMTIVAGIAFCGCVGWLAPAPAVAAEDAQSAQGQARGQAVGRRAKEADVSRMDRNGDGIVRRDEWTGSKQEFERRDWNHDGMLSGDELRYSAPPCEATGRSENEQATSTGPAGRGAAAQAADDSSPAYQAGFDRGIADGRQAGKEDKQLRNAWDLEGQRELETADAGYQAQMGSRANYQAGYRAGFRFGYRQGFGPQR